MLAALAGACGSPKVQVFAPPAASGEAAPAAQNRLPPARWVRTSTEGVVGLWSAAGTLGIVGGRRTLVGKDGSVRVETVPSPEPLHALTLVPTPGEARLVGLGDTTLYRFDDPLGEGRPLVGGVRPGCTLGSMPGLVVVRCGSVVGYHDIESGEARPSPAGLPEFPMLDVRFLDSREGAALFSVRGLVVTRDGGAHWQVPRPLGSAEELLTASALGQSAAGLYALAASGKGASHINLARSTLGRVEPLAAELQARAPRAKAGADGDSPGATLREAVSSGVEASDGGAWFLDKGRALEIDLRTEAVSTAVDGSRLGSCAGEVLRAGDTVWFACAEAVVRATVAGDALEVAGPEATGIAGGTLRVAPSGGVLRVATTGAELSVRQPDRTWKKGRAWPNAGALADGRLAWVTAQTDAEAKPRVVVMDLGSVVMESAPPLDLNGFTGTVTPIEEGRDGVLRFVAADARGLVAVAQPLGGDARLTRIPGATRVRMRAGRGVALGPGTMLATVDGGETWSPVVAPPGALAAALEMGDDGLAVSAVGARVGDCLRIGWGPSDAVPGSGPAPARFDEAPASGKLHGLVCRDDGPSTSAVLPGNRESATASMFSDLGPIATLAEVSNPVTRWTLTWTDFFEAGTAHTWSGPPRVPPSLVPAVAAGTTLSLAAARGDQALFALRVTAYAPPRAGAGDGDGAGLSPNMLLRTRAGHVEVAARSTEGGDAAFEPAFGSGPGAPIAWIEGERLQVWAEGATPRALARLSGIRSAVAVGEPTKDGVPLLVYDGDWAATVTVPINTSAVQTLAPGGWRRLSAPVAFERLPACGAGVTGARYRVRGVHHGTAELDGSLDSGSSEAMFEVRVAGDSACLAGVSRRLSLGAPKGAAFVRADLIASTGEGGAVQVGASPGTMRKLLCGWVPAP